MTLKNLIGSIVIAAALSTPALANNENGFSALQGVEVQALSSQEMAAISGELNAFDTAAALQGAATKLDRFPRLQASTLKLADYYLTNAVRINAAFVKLGVFTPCHSC